MISWGNDSASVMSNYRYLEILDQELGTNCNTHLASCSELGIKIGLAL